MFALFIFLLKSLEKLKSSQILFQGKNVWNKKAQVLLFLGIYKGSKFIDDLPYFLNILENQILDGEL